MKNKENLLSRLFENGVDIEDLNHFDVNVLNLFYEFTNECEKAPAYHLFISSDIADIGEQIDDLVPFVFELSFNERLNYAEIVIVPDGRKKVKFNKDIKIGVR